MNAPLLEVEHTPEELLRMPEGHRYDLIDPSPDITVLLHEIDRDPTCIFWG